MDNLVTDQQKQRQIGFRAFVDEEVIPIVDQYDQEEQTPPELIKKMARAGYLGAAIPVEYGGSAFDAITLGFLCEEFGRGCSSLRSLLTVHTMVASAILRWGTKDQKAHWLPKLATGEIIGAFGLSEPNVGSDAKSVETVAVPTDKGYLLNGKKKWTTYGQIADLFLIFAQCKGSVTAFLVEATAAGFSRRPLHGIFGTSASMLAEITLEDCLIPRTQLLGGIGFGLASVATATLDSGRYTVAWGSVGILQACLESCLRYTSTRQQFGVPLKEHQLIQQLITRMMTDTRAARLLCLQAGFLKDGGDPRTVMETWVAKYFASTAAVRAANDALQIHGANGFSREYYAVQRYLRDAKVMEVIEGSTQIQEITIARYGYQEQSR
ncbi:acyl-CoA dehydrogenase family protein [Tengunoibacter tsumagoiensis]|uniref:Acyl-CoA dehydrogenase n=1 Tax=Tengunoibacter tsumagoiensis TaxID=2014871 RepID=A0A402A923_9CHLR|nr:acyl-CoA dehydrogenase family protein [Tengunoibacter tsumagoiensis]GCE15662.1 acyl-CoA dehydrogenase [Tengunoibacter tsumagoiensis]